MGMSAGGVCRATFDKRCVAKWCPITQRAAAATAVQTVVDTAASSPQSPQQQRLPHSPQPIFNPADTPTPQTSLPRVPSRQESLDSDFPEEIELSETGRPGVLTYVAAALQNGVQDSAQISLGAFKSLLRTFQRASPAAPLVQPTTALESSGGADTAPTTPDALGVSQDVQDSEQQYLSEVGNAIMPVQMQSHKSQALQAQQAQQAQQPMIVLTDDQESAIRQPRTQDGHLQAGNRGYNTNGGTETPELVSNPYPFSFSSGVKMYGNAIGMHSQAGPLHQSASPDASGDLQDEKSSISQAADQQQQTASMQRATLDSLTPVSQVRMSTGPVGEARQATAEQAEVQSSGLQQNEANRQLGGADAQLNEATGRLGEADAQVHDRSGAGGVDGSLEKELTGCPAALIPDEVLNGVATAACAESGAPLHA